MLRRNPKLFELAPSGSLIRAFRVDQVLSKISNTDYVYALQSAPQLFTFISRRDADSLAVAKELMKIDQRDRCVHAVFGRPKVPVDFFADIEFPTYAEHIANERAREGLIGATNPDAPSRDNNNSSSKEEDSSGGKKSSRGKKKGGKKQQKDEIVEEEEINETTTSLGRSSKEYTGDEIVIDVIKAATDLLQERFKVTPSVTSLYDGGKTTEKHSYHLHIRMKDAAFVDYSVLQEVYSEINFAVGIQAIDVACCRPNGMLRMVMTPKFTNRDRVLRSIHEIEGTDPELLRMCKSMKELSPEELFAMSLVNRTDELRNQDPNFKLLTAQSGGYTAAGAGSRGKRKKEFDVSGREISAHLEENKKPIRFREACARVHSLPMWVADDYNTWVRVGLSLHGFGPDPAAYQHWLQFSAKSPAKFDPQVCEKSWAIFGRRPDCYNWRRGYLYVMKTLSSAAKGQRTGSGGGMAGSKRR